MHRHPLMAMRRLDEGQALPARLTASLPAMQGSPMQTDLASLAAFACELADAARRETLPRCDAVGTVNNKAGGARFDPVTEADRAAEMAIRRLIEQHWPDHGILGEEFADRAARSDYSWSLDPIDGTRSYVCGLPSWTTLIALLHRGRPMVGVIDAPRLGERYLGLGDEARLIMSDGERVLAVSSCRELAEARFSTTDPALFSGADMEGVERVREAVRIVRYGHDAYAYARLAAGTIDLVIEAGLQPYDYNALVPVVRGAGGVIGNWRGEDDLSEGKLVAAASQTLLEQAVALLHS